MALRIDDSLAISTNEDNLDKKYSAAQVIAVLEGNISGGGGGGIGRATQAATYITRTVNPPTIYYTALDTDQFTITSRTNTGVFKIMDGPGTPPAWTMYGYDQPLADGTLDWIAVWDEGVVSDYTAEWVTVGSVAGISSGGGGSGLAHAVFTMTQTTSTLITVDASASIGDGYAWTLDDVPQTVTDAVVTFGPLLVGNHTWDLVVTNSSDGSTATKTHSLDVAWVADPFMGAQVDPLNGVRPQAIDLPQWSTLATIGPYRSITILNEDEDYPTVGDGIPRIFENVDGSWGMYMKNEDHVEPDLYRPALQYNYAYDGRIGLPGEIQNIDVGGAGTPQDGSHGTTRFYRVEVMIPTTMSDSVSQPTPWTGINNVWETEVTASSIGTPMMNLGTNAAGDYWRMSFTPATLGVNGTQKIFAHRQIVHDQWVNRVVEILWDLDPLVGYIRVYEDGVALGAGAGGGVDPGMPVGTDGQGRYFCATARTNLAGTVILPSFNYQLYRNKAFILANPADPAREVHHRNVMVGPTLASVYP